MLIDVFSIPGTRFFKRQKAKVNQDKYFKSYNIGIYLTSVERLSTRASFLKFPAARLWEERSKDTTRTPQRI